MWYKNSKVGPYGITFWKNLFSAQNPPESGIVSPPNHGNESPVDFGHSAKRKPQHPVSMQQRIKTGLLGLETVEKLANAATEVVNKHDDAVEPVW